jgi:hypothetical protein
MITDSGGKCHNLVRPWNMGAVENIDSVTANNSSG